MHCKECGAQIPNESAFCSKCGASQRAEEPSSTPMDQRRWEYNEFIIDLSNLNGGKEFKGTGIPVDGSIPSALPKTDIDDAVRALLNEIASEGWEPVERFDADFLWRSSRLDCETKWSTWTGSPRFRLMSARLNCRRMI